MWRCTPLLAAALAAGRGPSARADPLPDPLPSGVALQGSERHPEFVRYLLRVDSGGPDGGPADFTVELTRSPGPGEAATEPVCAGGGVDLWVRLELGDVAESFDWDPLPPIVDQICGRLGEHAPALQARRIDGGPPAEPGAPQGGLSQPLPESHIWPTRPLHAAVLAWVMVLLIAPPRGWRPWALGALALALRVALSPRRVLLGGDAGYTRLLTGRGLEGSSLYYGDTWQSLMGMIWELLGEPADHVTAANLALSALAVPLLYGCVRALLGGGGEGAATAAALALALLPLPVAVSGSEVHFVLAGTLAVAALYGAARGDRRGAWLAALSAGLLAHLRPLQGLFALLPLALLVRDRRWDALALGLGLLGWRWRQILHHIGQQGRPPVLESAGLGRWDVLPGPGSALVPLDPLVTPLGLSALAALALWRARSGAHRRAALILLAALLTQTVPYLPMAHSSSFDPLRFQLPAQAWVAALAALAAPAVLAWSPRRRAAALGALALSWILARAPIGQPWAWTAEYRFLIRELGEVPEGITVRYEGSQDPDMAFHRWLNTRSAGRWLPLDGGEARGGEWRYVGTADRLVGRSEEPPCSSQVASQRVPPASDGWVDFGEEAVLLGLYRIEDCSGE